MPRNTSLSDNYVSDRCSFFRLAIGANRWFTAAHVPNLRSWPIYIPSYIYGLTTRRWLGLQSSTTPAQPTNHAEFLGFSRSSSGYWLRLRNGIIFFCVERTHCCSWMDSISNETLLTFHPNDICRGFRNQFHMPFYCLGVAWHLGVKIKSYSNVLVWMIFEIVSQKCCFVKICSW